MIVVKCSNRFSKRFPFSHRCPDYLLPGPAKLFYTTVALRIVKRHNAVFNTLTVQEFNELKQSELVSFVSSDIFW